MNFHSLEKIYVATSMLCLSTIFAGLPPNAGAQICVAPPNMSPGYTWPANTSVIVKIDSQWVDSDRQAFANGMVKWNGQDNCSSVTFSGFQPQNFTDYSAPPPDKTVYWQKDDPGNGYNGGVFYHISDNRIRAIRVKIHPGVANIANGSYFVYLGSHELGHTLGLDNCTCLNNCNCDGENGLSIMSGHSNNNADYNNRGPQACDNYAIKNIYCPCPAYSVRDYSNGGCKCEPLQSQLDACNARRGCWNWDECLCCVPCTHF